MTDKFSELATNIITSPILSFAGEINARKAKGEKIYNLTIGDFDPKIYPIPQKLTEQITKAYERGLTNYPGAMGLDNLRRAIQKLIKRYLKVEHDINNIQIASGSRPLIYSLFRTVLDAGDKVLFPVPSWNNDHYTMLAGACVIEVETKPQNNFMPTKDDLAPFIKDATLLALCSPQNPTGTVLSKSQLSDICDLVIAENLSRKDKQKPLYVMFDQVYWMLGFADGVFHHAETINPAIHDYAVFIDGISKNFAGTGVRVGWASGPSALIGKMRTILAHMGAWAPTPEQCATGVFLQNKTEVDKFLINFKARLKAVLDELYVGFKKMQDKGLPVEIIKPEASIYLSVKLDVVGSRTNDGLVLDTGDAITEYMLETARVAILPFSWFGAKSMDNWFRISVGSCRQNQVQTILANIENALAELESG